MAKRKSSFKIPETFVRCPRCGGTGCEAGAAVRAVNERHGSMPATCRQCEGKGKVPGVPEAQP
jgi:uncharacterized C2H2 Zn-finger protein